MLMDCMSLGTMANQIKSFRFYWSKLTKETWIRPKRNMRMRTMKSSVKPSTKPPRPAPPAGSRHHRLIEKVQHVLDSACLDHRCICEHGPGSIIEEYILGEKEKTKEGESEVQEAGTENPTD